MNSQKYIHPLDPECPPVKDFKNTLLNDRMTDAINAPVDDILEGFAKKHRVICERCQRYGAAHVYIGKS